MKIKRAIKKVFREAKRAGKIREKYGITKEEYRRENYKQLEDKALDKLLTDPETYGIVSYLAEMNGAPMGDVYAKALRVKKEYKLPIQRFARYNLYANDSEKEIIKAKRELDYGRQEKKRKIRDLTGMTREETDAYIKRMWRTFRVGLDYIVGQELYKMNDAEIAACIEKDQKSKSVIKERVKEANNWTDFDFAKSRALCRYRYHIYPLSTYYNAEFWKYPMEVLDTFANTQDSFDMRKSYRKGSLAVLSNKINFDREYRDFIGRKFWVNSDTSFEEFREFTEGLTEVFCKPVYLFAGKGCYPYQLSGDAEKDYEYFMNEPKMLIEEVPKQHHLINEIYDKSINTVRITCVLKDGKFVPFCSWIKFGGKGSRVDGRIAGGCFAGVDVKTGVVDTLAINKENERFDKHEDTGKQITGFRIPYWDEALDLAERALRHGNGLGMVGWDLCITENGPIIIEGNSQPALVDMQILYAYGENEGKGQRWRYYDLLEDPDKWRR